MRATTERSAADYLPGRLSLKSLRESAARCRGCDLYKYATQTVFGEGKARAPIVMVGEQPGNSEDLAGHPFVGPAGMLLRKSMEQAGIDAKTVYITNAVKHFKFIERGKKRIHQKPKSIEIQACSPWLRAEIRVVKPQLVVALGATAAQALLGASFRLTKHRGQILQSPLGARVLATVHPSSILRAPDSQTRRRELAKFVEDLRVIAAWKPQ
ncbi:MAG TPA: UdgX family uracil-DNA binding protein [Candidatus Baltobacteraceae bacterium]|nr:UdgX family uracil-DNA binding protein [Candidatus Baltobacteraceae bacterium]